MDAGLLLDPTRFQDGLTEETEVNRHHRQEKPAGSAGRPWRIDAVPAPLLVIAAILMVLVGHATAKHLLTPDTAFGLVFLRALVAAVMLLALTRPRLADLTRRQWINAVLFGIAITVFNGLFYLTIPRIPLAIAVTIGFLGPLAVGLLGARRPMAFLWPVLAFAGVLMLTPVGGVSDLDPVGVGLAFCHAATWAGYILMSARSARTTPGLTGLALAMTVAAFLTAPLGLTMAGSFLGSAVDVALVLLVALFTVLAYALEVLALKRMRPAVFGVLTSTEPAVAAVIAFILLGEMLSGIGWTALAVVTVAALGATVTEHKAA